MEIHSVKCDHCGKEMTEKSEYPHHWGLRLSAVDHIIPPGPGASRHMVSMPSLVEKPLDFCDFKCLEAWVVAEMDKAREEAVMAREQYRQWKDEQRGNNP